MCKQFIGLVLILCISCSVVGASLEDMCGKMPPETVAFIATSGTENIQSDFQNSVMGQIAADPQVKTYFDQLIASVSKLEDLKGVFNQGEDYVEFVKSILASPTVLGFAPKSEKASEEFYAFLLSERIAEGSPMDALFKQKILSAVEAKTITQRDIEGHQVYLSSDPNACTTYYISQVSDMLLFAVDDPDYSILKRVINGAYNSDLAASLASVPSTNDAFVIYVDFHQMLSAVGEAAQTDTDSKDALAAFESLGFTDLQNCIIKAGFEGKNLTIDGKIKTQTSEGIWNAIGSVDKGLFDYVDPKAMQSNAVFFDPVLLYDSVLNCVSLAALSEGVSVEPKIAEFEKQIGIKLRDDLMASLEGSIMGYFLPPYSSPELLTGAYVLTARLKDTEKFKKSLLSLETLVKTKAPADQLQITVQKDAAGNEIHIWAVSLMAMMQVIPSWTVKDNMLIVSSHPNVTMKMLNRIASGPGDSLVSNSEFAAALGRVPSNAFSMSLTDSKAQARQLMTMLQQYLPMLNMGLMQEGIQLPIMLPSIEQYIEQMGPGLSYASKSPDGIEFRYEGAGLEASSVGVAGGAMGVAVLMPALSKSKKVAQRVVCGTNLKGLSTAMFVYCNDYDDTLPTTNWCDLLIEEADVSPKSFVCPQSDAIEGESSYALNVHIAGKNLGKLGPNVVMLFETDKGKEDGPRSTSVLTRRHHQALDIYEEDTMVYKDCYNQLGGPEDIALHHNNSGKVGCNIAFADGHTEFVTVDQIAELKWTVD